MIDIRSRAARRGDQRGYALTELMTSIVTFALVGTALASVFAGSVSSFGTQNRMIDAQVDLASAMALVQDDLRAAGYITDNMNQAIFQQITSGTTADTIEFVGDVNGDGVSDRITYTLNNGTLLRTQDIWNGVAGWNTSDPQPLAANITKFTVTFNLVDPCNATVTQQTAAQVLGTQQTSFMSVSLAGSWTYRGTTMTRTLASDVAERQQNVRPTCS